MATGLLLAVNPTTKGLSPLTSALILAKMQVFPEGVKQFLWVLRTV